MGKVTVTIHGYGKVVVKRPSKRTKAALADTIADAVGQTCGLLVPNSQSERFHPVLGKGGYNWDHASQRAAVQEAQTPRVAVENSRLDQIRFHLQGLWNNILHYERELQKSVDR